jgi:hypothetical protein
MDGNKRIKKGKMIDTGMDTMLRTTGFDENFEVDES